MTNPATSFAIWIEPVLNRWKSILVAIATIFGTLYGGYAFAQQQFDDAVNSRVEAQFNLLLAGLAEKRDFKSLERRLNGIQEQTTTSASDRRVIKEQLESTRREQKQGFENINQKFDLFLKLYEQK